MMIIKYAKINGPRINPKIPNKKNPPIIPIRVNAGCILAFFEIIIGFKKISNEEAIKPKTVIPKAEKKFPAIRM